MTLISSAYLEIHVQACAILLIMQTLMKYQEDNFFDSSFILSVANLFFKVTDL